MSEWPEGWFRGTPGADKDAGGPGSGDPTADLPVRPRAGAPRQRAPRPAAGGNSPGAAARGAWPQQPPASRGAMPGGRGAMPPGRGGPGGRGGIPPGTPPGAYGAGGYRPNQDPSGYRPSAAPGGPGSLRTGGGRHWLRPRRVFGVLAVLVALVLVATVALYFNVNGKLDRKNVLPSYSGQPAQGDGTNWLIAGSDSRQGLTTAQEKRLATGFDVSGHRSDTILILHVPSSGRAILISLPRDSWVDIPGHGFNKINAAYSFGGPRLLAATVQNATGLRIDHYMEIGFGGFVHVVNAVGGVRMCIKHPLHDVASGLNIKKGCQTFFGAKALGFVRDRHNFAGQDLQRVKDQRLLLKALLSKLTSAGVLLNPFAAIPAADGVASTLTVDHGTNLIQLAKAAFALRGPETTTVPIASSNFLTPTGEDAVKWDSSRALELFNAMNDGKTVPKGLITGSSQG